MDTPRELILQDVRCFKGTQRGRLRPLTLLVGENSTGKTTFLGCYSILHQVLSRREVNVDGADFNEQPFLMGSFRDIVRSRRGRNGRIDEFRLGLTAGPDKGARQYEIVAAFSEEGSQPVVSSLRYTFDSGSFLELCRGDNGDTRIVIPDYEVKIDYPFGIAKVVLSMLISGDSELPLPQEAGMRPIIDYLDKVLPKQGTGPGSARRRRSGLRFPLGAEVIPVAPLRSRPKRTYDPVRETTSPEGEHIPMLMMRLDRTDKSHWNSLHDDLIEFGRGSGLFADIKVKRHGKQMSDPFQLQVKVRSGPLANIMDVGYGVSQSLPILVDVLAAEAPGRFPRGEEGRTFLLQQPEVHLHPRGQAELASLLIESFRKLGNRFLIETHSDYIVDRVRICVREGTVKADDVSILYFEPKGNAVAIHSMTLDDHGNLQDAPAGYRDFFAKETDRLLGFAD